MKRAFGLILLVSAPLTILAGDAGKKNKDLWAKIITETFTEEMNKKALDFEKNAIVKPETMLNYDVKLMGGAGKFSKKAIQKKYGQPTKIEKFATKQDGKIVNLEEWQYPPIAFTFVEGSDEPRSVGAPKRLWTGKGILENAKEVLKNK
jgi:hypothetical protein